MSELPEGWAECELQDVLEPERGIFDGPFGSSLKTADYVDAGARVIRLENLATFRFIDSKKTWISLEKFDSLRKHEVRAGDLIVGSFVDDTLRVCIVPESGAPAIVKADCFCVRSRDALIDRRFLMYQLGLTSTKDDLVREIHGATRPRITTKQLKTVLLKLPPRAEQHRIARRVDALLAHVSRTEEQLASSASRLHAAKASLRGAAVAGELAPKEVEDTVDYVPLRVLAERFDYGTSAKSTRLGDVPVLRMGNINDGVIDWDDLVYTSDANEIQKYALMPGDVLFNRTNSPELVGKTAIYRGERPAIHAGYLVRIRCGSKLLPEFLNLCLNSPAGRSWCHSVKTDGVSQSNISASKLKEFAVPAFSLEQQRRIIAAHRVLTGIMDAAERRVRVAAAASVTMQRVILAKAFAGELVVTEAELARREHRRYEPASVLLERVSAIRGGTPAARRRR